MHPVLLRLGPVTVHTYGALLAAAVLLGLWLARRRAIASELDSDRVWNLGVYMVLGGLVGAKLWLVGANWSYYLENPRQIFAVSTLQSAGVFYGGLFAALLIAVIYAHRAEMRFLALADVYAPAVALGLPFARLGCFSAGCCWGKPTDLPWGVTFTSEYAGQVVGTPLGQPLHPTQLYEVVAVAGIFFILLWLGRRQSFTGQLFAAFVILYGVARGIIEFFRADPDRTLLFDGRFSLIQFVSIGLIMLGAWLWWKRPGNTPEAQ